MYVYILVSSPLHVYFHVWCTCTTCSSTLLGAFIYQNLFPSAPVWVRPSDHSALCFQLLHASTLACIMDLPVTAHKHPKGTTLTIPTVSFPPCRFIDTGLLISLSWSCCFLILVSLMNCIMVNFSMCYFFKHCSCIYFLIFSLIVSLFYIFYSLSLVYIFKGGVIRAWKILWILIAHYP